ncbi:hypothetical protein HR12_44950 [Microbacterium sp. SUBG005]|nr:hypothetical protein HR12_44950 [Microbacterium sp. SUBG005]
MLLRRTHLAFVGGHDGADAARGRRGRGRSPRLGCDRVDDEISRTTEILRSAHRVDLAQAGVARI